MKTYEGFLGIKTKKEKLREEEYNRKREFMERETGWSGEIDGPEDKDYRALQKIVQSNIETEDYEILKNLKLSQIKHVEKPDGKKYTYPDGDPNILVKGYLNSRYENGKRVLDTIYGLKGEHLLSFKNIKYYILHLTNGNTYLIPIKESENIYRKISDNLILPLSYLLYVKIGSVDYNGNPRSTWLSWINSNELFIEDDYIIINSGQIYIDRIGDKDLIKNLVKKIEVYLDEKN